MPLPADSRAPAGCSRAARSLLHLALLLALPCLLLGCLAPPALQQAPYLNAEVAIGLYPEGSEPVELPLASGERLRGIFVPASEGAPVVLHLLESAGSIATLKYHYSVLCKQLQGLGYASLIVDYRGIGASDGSPSACQLREDAQALWQAAVERAGGDPSRVILRGISLGSVATAQLLESGAQPAALLLHAPVFGYSAVERYAGHHYGALVSALSGLLFGTISKASLVEQLEGFDGPVHVVVGERDFFLSERERELLARALQAPGQRLVRPDAGHLKQVILAHALDLGELELLLELFPPEPLDEQELDRLLVRLVQDPSVSGAVAARFEQPEIRGRLALLGGWARNARPLLLGAIALRNEPSLEALRYLWMLDEDRIKPEPKLEYLLDCVSLEDPHGDLDMDTILDVAQFANYGRRYGNGGFLETVFTAVLRADASLKSDDGRLILEVETDWDRAVFISDPMRCITPLRDRALAEEEIRRITVRTILKGARIPERVVQDAQGKVLLQVLEQDAWKTIDLDPEKHPTTVAAMVPFELGLRALDLLEAQQQPEED